jgi:signal peptidase
VAATTIAAGAAVALTAPGRWPLVVVLVGALLWGLGGVIAVALTPNRRPDADPAGAPAGGEVEIGIAMHLGDVPDEVARTTSAIAAAAGPVALVLPAGRPAPADLDPSVLVVASGEGGGTSAAMSVLAGRCDAVLFTSARALPGDGVAAAARALSAGAAWVTGAAAPLNRDRFGPTRRELLDGRLRRRASATGLWCWEPDATVVRTSLLERHPFRTGRPLGSWLRERADEGAIGATIDTTITRRAAPVAAEGYWPETTARQRAAAADLSDAALSGRCGWRARAVAAGLLVRALSGWSVVLWLAALVLLAAGSPFRGGELALGALVAIAITLRWLAPLLATGTRPAPIADVVAALYALPGSVAATASALTRRVTPARRRVPTRPLVWLALLATGAAAAVVLTARPGDGAARAAAGAAAVLLVLLWVFTVRSLVERSWRRVGFRIPLDLPAVVGTVGVARTGGTDGTDGFRLVDGSPGGFGLLGPATGRTRGDDITVRVPRPSEPELVLHGTVAGRRHRPHGLEVLGVELRTVEPGTAAWGTLLLEGASTPSASPATVVDERTDVDRWGRWADRFAVGLALCVSIAVLVTLALVLAGVRPLVVRSGSMEPTYAVGDVVLVASEQAGDVEVGQVVTRYDAPEAFDSLTHRVQDVSRSGDAVQVTTRGDANQTSERWTVPAEQQVGVVVAALPAVGLPLTAVRSSSGWAVLVGVAVLAVIAILFRPRRRGSLTSADDLPTEPAASSIGERP